MNELRDLWDKFHREDNIDQLSNNGLQRIIGLLNIRDEFDNAETVLEIGVGTGKCSEEIHKAGKTLCCVDISELALYKVAHITERTYINTSVDYLPNDFFDLAISFCVAPHISDEELRRHIRYTLEALKPGGVFAMQFTFSMNDSENDQNITDPTILAAGRGCRTDTYVIDMIHECGGEVLWVSMPKRWELKDLAGIVSK